jgi:hypothetical protein
MLKQQLASLRGLKKAKKGAAAAGADGGEKKKSRKRRRKRGGEDGADRACFTSEALDAVRDSEKEQDHTAKNLAFFRGEKKVKRKKASSSMKKVLKMAEKSRKKKSGLSRGNAGVC